MLTYAPADFVAAHRLHIRYRLRNAALACVGIGLALVALTALFRDYTPAVFALEFGIGGPALLGLLYYVYVPWKMRRQFNRFPRAKSRFRITLASEGLHSVTENSRSLIAWRELIGWRADPVTTILYASPGLYHILPARWTAFGFPYVEMQSRLSAEVKRWP